MFVALVPSSPGRRTTRPAARSWSLALLGHGTLCAAGLWGTLRPHTTAAADAVPMLIAWLQPDQGESVDRTTSTGPIDVALPPLPTVDLPPLAPLPLTHAGAASRERASALGAAAPQPAADDPWNPALVDEAPALLAARMPPYPDMLRAAGITGRVVLEAVIDTLGRAEPGSAVVVQSANPGFDGPARQYILGAQFRPARVHGRAVRVLIRVPIDFTLAAR